MKYYYINSKSEIAKLSKEDFLKQMFEDTFIFNETIHSIDNNVVLGISPLYYPNLNSVKEIYNNYKNEA